MEQPVNAAWSAARAVGPTVLKWRDSADRERRLPGPLLDAIREAGLFALGVDPELGGAGLDDVGLVRVIEELSAQDGSVGWSVMIAANGARIARHLPGCGQREIYAHGPSAVIAGSLSPNGTAELVPGGFCLTGRWSMASGCNHADWVRGPATLTRGGLPVLRVDGTPETRIFHVPVADCDIPDTWHTAGLRGTGSHDLCVERIFVPEARSVQVHLAGGTGTGPGELAHEALTTRARPMIAAVALGIARDAIASFAQMVGGSSDRPIPNQHSIHDRIGRAEGLVRAARAFLFVSLCELPDLSNWSVPLTQSHHADIRLAAAYAARSAAKAVDLLYDAAGASAICAGNRLERCFRDIHALTHHIGVASANFEIVGQHLLGLDGLDARRAPPPAS